MYTENYIGEEKMLTDSSFSNNPREANEEHDTPDIQHASYLWIEGALKEMRNDRGQNSGLCNSGVQALSTLGLPVLVRFHV